MKKALDKRIFVLSANASIGMIDPHTPAVIAQILVIEKYVAIEVDTGSDIFLFFLVSNSF
jgi:hypothetical protein